MVFHLPGAQAPLSGAVNVVYNKESSIYMDTRMSNEDLLLLMKLLMKYLMDDSVAIIEMASQALQVSLLK